MFRGWPRTWRPAAMWRSRTWPVTSRDTLGETFRRLSEQKMADPVVLRSRDEVAALFGALEVTEPGVVQLPQWHPDPDAPAPGPLPMWCGSPVRPSA